MDIIFITQRSIPNGGLRHCTKLFLRQESEHGKAETMNQPIMLLVWHPPVEMLAGARS